MRTLKGKLSLLVAAATVCALALSWLLIEGILHGSPLGWRAQLFLAMTITAAVTLFLELWVVRNIVHPLTELTEAAESVERGEATSIPLVGSLEIRRLSAKMKGWLERLQSALSTLQMERDDLASILETLPIGVMVTDEHGRLRYANSALERFLNLSREWANKPIMGLLNRSELLELADAVHSGITPEPIIFKALTEPERYLRAQARPLRQGILITLEDLTEQYQLEEARRNFVADAGHELQTPLTAIRAAAELLIENPDIEEPQKGKILRRIVEQQERISALVDDLLLLSRLESRPPTEEMSEIDLAYTVAFLAKEYASHPLASHIKIECSLPSSAPLKGRYEELRRAIGNLLDNAVKYVHQRFGDSSGGRVSIALSDEGSVWTLCVRDNGVGIPPGVADRIFERFQRGEASRSRFGKGGYGLGLSIAKRIIETHGGDIFLEPTKEGATFVIRLPKSQRSTEIAT